MARGWESKSVEQQQEMASSDGGRAKSRLTAEEIAAERRRGTLRLSRRRVMEQLEAATNPRHREVLEAALAALASKLGRGKQWLLWLGGGFGGMQSRANLKRSSK